MIPKGRIVSIDIGDAHEGRRRDRGADAQEPPATWLSKDSAWKDDVAPEKGSPFRPLDDDKIIFSGQPIALVLAEEWDIALYAASLVRIDYEAEAHSHRPVCAARAAFVVEKPEKPRGNAEKAYAAAAVRHEAEYFMPIEHHNPMDCPPRP